MKIPALAICTLMLFSGCSNYTTRLNKQLSEYCRNNKVVLEKANYKVIKELEGKAVYVNIIDSKLTGHSLENLFPRAISNMYKNVEVDYKDKPIAFINIRFEKISLQGILQLKVYGTLIEFTN